MPEPKKPEAPNPPPETPPTPPVPPTSEARVSDSELSDAWDKALLDETPATPAPDAAPVESAAATPPAPETPPSTPPAPAAAPVASAETPPDGTTPDDLEDLNLDPRTPEGRKNRSNLGRTVAELKAMVEKLVTARPEPAPQPPATPATPEPAMHIAAEGEEEIPEEYSDLSDPVVMSKFLDWKETKRREASARYENAYVQTVWKFKAETGDDHDKIVDLMAEKFNTRRGTGNPVLDAQLNYSDAARAYYRIKLAQPSAPLATPPTPPASPVPPPRHATPVAAGVTVPRTNVAPAGDVPALDEFAADFVKRTQMKPESVKAALLQPLPPHVAAGGARR